MYLGVNAYSIRKLLMEKQIGVWSSLKNYGFDHVELLMTGNRSHPNPPQISADMAKWIEQFRKFVVPLSESGPFVREIQGHGLNIDCIHVALTQDDLRDLDHLAEEIIAFSQDSRIRNFVIGIDQFLDQILDICPAIDRMASTLKQNNLQLIYHNHHKEWEKFSDSTYLEHLLSQCPDLMIEVDVGWMYYAGVDVLPFLSRYTDRLAYIHLKDLVIEQGGITFKPIGSGDVPIVKVLDFASKNGFLEKMIIDQDDSSDIMEDLKIGIDFIQKNIG